MIVQRAMLRLVVASCSLVYQCAYAQVPLELVGPLRDMGRVVNFPAVADLYASRVLEHEPYRNVRIERDLRYGKAQRNQLDVFSPIDANKSPRSVLIFVHGGGFVTGNRHVTLISPFYDNVMLWAVRHGMVGVNMSYRLAPKDPWPAGAEDVAQAVGWVAREIAARGGDPSQIFLLGHSSGAAHVATYIAHPEFQPPSGAGIAGALLLSGVYRITTELVDRYPSYIDYYGFDESDYEARSSLAGLGATRVPLWIGTAELDPPQFEQQANLLETTLCDAGHCPIRAHFAGHSHMSEVLSLNTDDDSVGRSMLRFIQSQ